MSSRWILHQIRDDCCDLLKQVFSWTVLSSVFDLSKCRFPQTLIVAANKWWNACESRWTFRGFPSPTSVTFPPSLRFVLCYVCVRFVFICILKSDFLPFAFNHLASFLLSGLNSQGRGTCEHIYSATLFWKHSQLLSLNNTAAIHLRLCGSCGKVGFIVLWNSI